VSRSRWKSKSFRYGNWPGGKHSTGKQEAPGGHRAHPARNSTPGRKSPIDRKVWEMRECEKEKNKKTQN
jgi:hypothetical protein